MQLPQSKTSRFRTLRKRRLAASLLLFFFSVLGFQNCSPAFKPIEASQTSTATSIATPSPTPAPTPAPAPAILLGWQLTASNTGLAGAGVDRNSLPVYTGPSTPPAGTVIRLQKITKPLNLLNGNITLDRVWMQPTTASGLGGMLVTYDTDYGADHGAPGPVTIMDSDFDGSLVTDPMIYQECAVRGAANAYRNNMFGMGSGICIFGSPAMPNMIIENNYVHDIRGGIVNGEQSHNETATVRNFSGTSMIWRGNYLVSKSGSDSGALFIQAWAGPIRNVTVDSNYMDSYGWDLFLDPNAFGYSNMIATDNRFGKSGYGASAVQAGPGWTQFTNNYYYDATRTDAKGAAVGQP